MNVRTALDRARSLERELTGSRGIRKARVDVATDGAISIEVLAVPERSERSVRAQILAAARESLGSDLNPAAITVLSADRGTTSGREQPRRKLTSLVTRRALEQFSTQVLLSRGGDVATGEAECAAFRNPARAVAQAVLDGLGQVAERPLQLQEVDTVRMGEQTLAVVCLKYGDRVLLGSAEVHFDLPDAVARATLHALNRSLNKAS